MSQAQPNLGGYEVVVGVSGGIAAYKTCSVVSALVARGAGVTVVMTEAATRLVGPTTFAALTGRRVHLDTFADMKQWDMQHIALADLADLMLIAPATANILAKVACGLADDILSTTAVTVDCPLLLAPAMNTRMWNHPAVQANCRTLAERGLEMIGPETGRLACGTEGPGRMSEPQKILDAVSARLLAGPPKKAAGDKRP
jgi:phosphopantothenoylcysteine decarboxylase/phosphopantothenate--cysteine ligase